MKQKYYRLDKIKKVDAQYKMLLGERSNGKSYAVKEDALQDAWSDDNKKFIYLRRWDLECKPSFTEQYFLDAPISAITKGEADTIVVYMGKIFFAKYDEETRKPKKIKYVDIQEHFPWKGIMCQVAIRTLTKFFLKNL